MGKVLGKNVVEGNTNGLLHHTRNRIYRIMTGVDAPTHRRSGDLRAAQAAAGAKAEN